MFQILRLPQRYFRKVRGDFNVNVLQHLFVAFQDCFRGEDGLQGVLSPLSPCWLDRYCVIVQQGGLKCGTPKSAVQNNLFTESTLCLYRQCKAVLYTIKSGTELKGNPRG